MAFLNGCEAVARGAWEAGAAFVGSYPGSPVTGVVEGLLRFPEIKTQWMANEKVALEAAIGAAHAGQRALAVMKHVGLNVAADPFFNVAYTGTRGGLVIVVGDDPGAKASQNEQDTRQLAQAAHVPVLEPSDIDEALIFPRLAFEISEQFDVPVVVRVTTPICYGTSRTVMGARRQVLPNLGFAAPIEKYLLLPAFVPARHKDLVRRIDRLANGHWSRWFMQTLMPAERLEKYPYGIVVTGFPYHAVRELFEGRAPILKAGMSYPLNEEAILEFAARCDRILVVEESSRFLEQRIRALGVNVAARPHFDGVGEFSLKHLESPDIPEIAERLQERIGHKRKVIPIRHQVTTPESHSGLPLPPRPPRFLRRLLSSRDLLYAGQARSLCGRRHRLLHLGCAGTPWSAACESVHGGKPRHPAGLPCRHGSGGGALLHRRDRGFDLLSFRHPVATDRRDGEDTGNHPNPGQCRNGHDRLPAHQSAAQA